MKTNLTGQSIVQARLQLLRKLFTVSLMLWVIGTASAQQRLVGLASEGGAYGGGTIFQINVDGSALSVLHDFQQGEGTFPIGTLIQMDEWLYGVTRAGGAFGFGTIFRIRADGSSHTVLFNFTDNTGSPAGPMLLTQEHMLFGVTVNTNAGFGTTYKISPTGAGYQEVYRFEVDNTEMQPGFVMQSGNGTIYGTSYSGGGYGFGHAFRLNADGSNPTILVHFSWEDGEYLNGGLMQANDGVLYGTAAFDGMMYGEGVVYRLAPDGAVVLVMHHFNSAEGHRPGGTLVQAPDNALYGMTLEAGQYNNGSLYRISPDSSDFSVLEHFDGNNGKGSANSLVYYREHLYGCTTTGGLSDAGVIFTYDVTSDTYTKLADLSEAVGRHSRFGSLLLLDPVPAVDPSLAATNLQFSNVKSHSMTLTFTPGDGMNHLVVTKPGSAPTFEPEDDHLYLGDIGDGVKVLYNGPKTSFELTGLAPGTRHYFEIFEYNTDFAGNISYLSSHAGASQATLPYSNTATRLVTVTRHGGPLDAGTMISMKPDGSDFTVLYNFDGLTGSHQVGKFLISDDGYLYGVSRGGGAFASGTLYKIKPDGTGHTVVHHFTRQEGYPTSAPVQIEGGTFVGVSLHDEANYGLVYKMNPDGTGYTEIYRFGAPLGFRQPGYISRASNGYLFVTTYSGGIYQGGMILRLDPDGTNPQLMHSFTGGDGYFAYSLLTEAADSTLYGVAHLGGPGGAGVVYKTDSKGNNFALVHGFNGGDGAFPAGALTQAEDGTLYGTAIIGGIDDGGVMYKMNADGSGFQVLYYFSPSSGRGPGCDLLLYGKKLYGFTGNAGQPQQPGEGWPGGTVFYYDLDNNSFHKIRDLTAATGHHRYWGGFIRVGLSPEVPGVKDFSLVNARTGQTITKFDRSITIDAGHPDFARLTIQANTYPNEVGSVRFKIDNLKKIVDNKAPYQLPNNYLRALSSTPHVLTAEAFTSREAGGQALKSRTAVINFVNRTVVTGFEVVDASGDKIQNLHDGDTLHVQDSTLRHFNIRAILDREVNKSSVQFYLNGKLYRNENYAPYLLAPGNRKWWNKPGLYTVSAIPFSGRDGHGTPGTPQSVAFFIVDTAAGTTPFVGGTGDILQVNIYPVPAQSELNIVIATPNTEGSAHIVIWDIMGKIRFNGYTSVTPEPSAIDLTGLQKGLHFIRIECEAGSKVSRFIKE